MIQTLFVKMETFEIRNSVAGIEISVNIHKHSDFGIGNSNIRKLIFFVVWVGERERDDEECSAADYPFPFYFLIIALFFFLFISTKFIILNKRIK